MAWVLAEESVSGWSEERICAGKTNECECCVQKLERTLGEGSDEDSGKEDAQDARGRPGAIILHKGFCVLFVVTYRAVLLRDMVAVAGAAALLALLRGEAAAGPRA